jgi:hypothetical protein
MSYSYGGKQTVKSFNDTVSKWKAPPSSVYGNIASLDDGILLYKGNIKEADGQIAVGESHKWAGLYSYRPGINGTEYSKWQADGQLGGHRFSPSNWAGVDCIGLVQRTLQAAEEPFEGQLNLVKGPINNKGDVAPITDERQISWGIGAQGLYAKGDEAYKTIIPTNLIKKGDVAFYGNISISHITIVYSERWGISEKLGNYDIIHAYGNNSFYDKELGEDVFSRKVIITDDEILVPKRIGRIKIWE